MQISIKTADLPLSYTSAAASRALRDTVAMSVTSIVYKKNYPFFIYLRVQTLSHAMLFVCNRQVYGRPGQMQVGLILSRHGQADVPLLVPHRPPLLSAALLHRSLSTDGQCKNQQSYR